MPLHEIKRDQDKSYLCPKKGKIWHTHTCERLRLFLVQEKMGTNTRMALLEDAITRTVPLKCVMQTLWLEA